MAMSSSVVTNGVNTRKFAVIATADADTGDLAIAHGMSAAPAVVLLTPLLLAGTLSGWSLKSVDATNITLNKGATTAGSGNAAAQLWVSAMLPHSLIG